MEHFTYNIWGILLLIYIMKHTISRSVAILIGMGLFSYVGRLFFQGYTVVWGDSQVVNMTALILCAALALIMLIVVFFPTFFPTNRWFLLIVWVLTILLSDIYLQDAPNRMVYLQDITKLVWVFLVIVWPMKLLLNQQAQEKLAEKNVEIIEV